MYLEHRSLVYYESGPKETTLEPTVYQGGTKGRDKRNNNADWST